jgi:hypothetical protein
MKKKTAKKKASPRRATKRQGVDGPSIAAVLRGLSICLALSDIGLEAGTSGSGVVVLDCNTVEDARTLCTLLLIVAQFGEPTVAAMEERANA